MKYIVTVRVYALYTASIEANNIEDAKDMAESEFGDIGLNDNIEVDECRTIMVEDENGVVWEAWN